MSEIFSKIGPLNKRPSHQFSQVESYKRGSLSLSDEIPLVVYETQNQRRERIARENSLHEWRKKRSRNAARNTIIRRDVLMRADDKCEVCGFGFSNILNIHHILPVKLGGQARRKNLIALCPNCHGMVHHYGRRQQRPEHRSAHLRGVMGAGYSLAQAEKLLLIASQKAAVSNDGVLAPYNPPRDMTRFVLIDEITHVGEK